MFAYCNNNPVCFSDPTGRSLWSIVIAVAAFSLALTGCASEPEPEFDYSIVPDLDVNTAHHSSYNCFGNAIGKEMLGAPPGYTEGDSTRKTFQAVKDFLGHDNVRELSAIDDPINSDEYMVAMKCGPTDFHFIRLTENGWYNKSGTEQGLYVSQSTVENNIWYPMYIENNQTIVRNDTIYNDETIYFAVKIRWDK